MEDRSHLVFKTSLQTFSAVTIAKILWDDPGIKTKIDEFLRSTDQVYPNQDVKQAVWYGITDFILKKLENLDIPTVLLTQLQNIIVFMAEQIYCMILRWLYYTYKFGLKHRPIRKFYFTRHGIIDECKIYREWKKNDSGKKNKTIDYFFDYCLYPDGTVPDEESLKEIENNIRSDVGLNVKIENFDKLIAVLLLSHRAGGIRPGGGLFARRLPDLENPNLLEQLLSYSIGRDFEKMFDYLYNQLDKSVRENMVIEAAETCIERLNPFYEISRDSEQTPQFLLYLFQKMSVDQKSQFLLRHKLKLFCTFLKTWPNKHRCVELLDYILDDSLMQSKMALLEISYDYLVKFSNLKLKTSIFHDIYRRIVMKIMARIPGDLKFHYFFSPDKSYNRLFDLFKASDFLSMKMIINDDDLLGCRPELIDVTMHLTGYDLFNFTNIKTQIDEFMNELEFSESEKLPYFQFFNNPNLYEKLLRLRRFDLADEFLQWLCDSKEKMDEKRKEIRESFDHMPIYSQMVNNREYTSSEIYLKWLYNEEYDAVQKSIFSFEFISEKIWFLWVETFASFNFNSYFSIMECSKFLIFYCKTEDRISSFKDGVREKPEYSINLFCRSVLELSFHAWHKNKSNPENTFNINSALWLRLTDSINFEAALDEAFDFCSVSSDKINEIKTNIRGNMDSWFGFLGTNQFEFLILNSLIEWLRFEENEKKAVVKNFIESKQGAMLCYSIFWLERDSECIDINEAARMILLCDWVMKYGDFKKIKETIKKDILSDNADPSVIDFFDKL